jgi:hypothetical protein
MMVSCHGSKKWICFSAAIKKLLASKKATSPSYIIYGFQTFSPLDMRNSGILNNIQT